MSTLLGLTTGWLPPALVHWPPVLQALVLGLATFVQEDVPTVTAATLAAAGALSTGAGFWGCFLGIWIGDLLLFALARGLGRPVLRLAWVRARVTESQLAQRQAWFARRGAWVLLSARMIPGTRLPTYLAAGLLRWPIGPFLLVTGVAAGVWTLVWFSLARVLGNRFGGLWDQWNNLGWPVALVFLTGALFFSLRLWPKSAQAERWCLVCQRWMQWEFWPAWLFYLPLIAHYIFLSIRYRGWTVPSAANPGMTLGGLVGESKVATLRDLWATSPEFTAEAWYLGPGTEKERLSNLSTIRSDNQLDLPFILKPDLGQRGMGVKLIRTETDAVACLRQNPAPLVVQRYVEGPLEAGVFYYRLPGKERGHLFAVTEKIFPVLVGDGHRTIEELILNDPRARFVADRYLKRFAHRRSEVLGQGASLRLVEAGNHAQGCIFRDGKHLATPELAAAIDAISRKLSGFFIGRYDVRYATTEDLISGRAFKILELNGASAEATSVYDARNSVFQAYRTLFTQWDLVFAIGAANRSLGCRPCGHRELWNAWRSAVALFSQYPLAD